MELDFQPHTSTKDLGSMAAIGSLVEEEKKGAENEIGRRLEKDLNVLHI
jgi:hypothetical protein